MPLLIFTLILVALLIAFYFDAKTPCPTCKRKASRRHKHQRVDGGPDLRYSHNPMLCSLCGSEWPDERAKRGTRVVASVEWTDWHLTETGWIRGLRRIDNKTTSGTDFTDSLSVFRYTEEISYAGSGTHGRLEKRRERSDRIEDISRAIEQFGKCPESL